VLMKFSVGTETGGNELGNIAQQFNRIVPKHVARAINRRRAFRGPNQHVQNDSGQHFGFCGCGG
jgi:hypothetical protein